MMFALLIHPNGMPEVVRAPRWGEAEVAAALRCAVVDSFPVREGQLLWQPYELDRDRPVNEAAELVAGPGNYLHLRGPALLTGSGGLSRDDITRITVMLGPQRKASNE